MLYAVDSGYFYAAIIVKNGVVVEAAPILRWSIGKTFEAFAVYANKKRWSIMEQNDG